MLVSDVYISTDMNKNVNAHFHNTKYIYIYIYIQGVSSIKRGTVARLMKLQYNSVFNNFKMKARSPGKFMDVINDLKVTDENDFLSHSMMNQSEEHHLEGANLDQSCRSTKIIGCLKEEQFEFLEERRRKNLALKRNVKRSGDFIPADYVGRLDTSQMTGRVSAGHEKRRQGSHVKRVIAVREEPGLHVNSTRKRERSRI